MALSIGTMSSQACYCKGFPMINNLHSNHESLPSKNFVVYDISHQSIHKIEVFIKNLQ